ncbi:hypothetical protein JKP88DRAFT_318745 [Tribonema minus]|uniref:Cysteine dioxygenase n=1 Tax=Tribonema minus TaxID=303371 RepID=A0A835YZW0_9STRA|nr:hypothetical protein JKP88DRAFT_318745 [Tribonema minus]
MMSVLPSSAIRQAVRLPRHLSSLAWANLLPSTQREIQPSFPRRTFDDNSTLGVGHLRGVDELHGELAHAVKAGHQFEDYGRPFIKNVKVDDWRHIASTSGALPYNKILIRDMGACSLFVISWRPFSGSPEHKHASGGCWFKVIEDQGASAVLTETRRDPTGRVTVHAAPRGASGFIHNRMGTHKVVNNTPAWVHSLHLYPNDP